MEQLLILVFVLGYLGIVFEHNVKINKTAFALFTGSLIWAIYAFINPDHAFIESELSEHLSEISSILFFLMGAMTIVELVDTFHGFDIITDRIKSKNLQTLLWIVSLITFFLSAALDNLTTTIVMITLLRKLIHDRENRMFLVGMVVIAANAGGAFSPIGDVTTTMLWIGGQVSTFAIIKELFLPSLVCLLIPLFVISLSLKGKTIEGAKKTEENHGTSFEKNLIFFLGIGGLLFVPVFKTFTHLPPYMGILFVLSILWIVSELLSAKKKPEHQKRYSIYNALSKLDITTILFFLGILLAVAGLQSADLLNQAATWLSQKFENQTVIVTLIGLLSSVVDNVPLVAGAMGMYSLETFPMDHSFWELLAYCAGTGGSCLIIGSAAGVAAMGMEKLDFFWYVKKISWLALIGYFSGIAVFILLN
ncbi:sodium:proton antiporter NhaD [Lacihabitans lacunae]|uniref:Sodium:proton antiporter NhaD n=1 Tax=Lacihabitans lacunae TaxID=1028214 RepID=A0ABV7YXZ7_9BACT